MWVTEFDKLGLAEVTLSDLLGRIETIRLSVNVNSNNWVIISEVSSISF